MGPGVSPPPSTTDTPMGACTADHVSSMQLVSANPSEAVLVCCVSDCTVDAEHMCSCCVVSRCSHPCDWCVAKCVYWCISTGRLHTLLCFQVRPINPVVFWEPQMKPHLKTGFPLRCFQRLSLPYVANQPCSWRNNWHTRGTSVPVLSY